MIIYDCVIFGNVVTFFNELGDRYLHELDSINKNITLGMYDVVQSWNANNFNVKYINTNQPNILKDSRMENYVFYGTVGTITTEPTESTTSYRVDIGNGAGNLYGIQTGGNDRTLSINNGETLTISYKMRGNIDTLNYAYIMRLSGGTNSPIISQTPLNLDDEEWRTITKTFTSPFTANNAYIMISYRNPNGDSGKWFEIKDIKLERGSSMTSFSYNPSEFSYTPYVIPMVDYGADSRKPKVVNDETIPVNYWDRHFDFGNFKPGIYVKAYLDAIFRGFEFTASGIPTQFKNGNLINKYQYESDLINGNTFKKLFIPFNAEKFVKKTNDVWCTANIGQYGFSSSFIRVSIFRNPNITFTSKYFEKVLVPTIHPDEKSPSEVFNNFYVIKAIDEAFKSHVKLTMNLKISSGAGKYCIGLIDVKNRNYISEDSFVLKEIINKTTGGEVNYSIDIQSTEPLDLSGEYTGCIIRVDGNTGINYSAENFNLDFGIDGVISEVPLLMNDTVNLFETIPRDVKIIDFLKSIMTLFNLYLIQDLDSESNFKILTYNDFYKDVIRLKPSSSLNWSKKVDMTNYSLDTNVNLPRNFIYQFESDSDMMNEYYNNRYEYEYGTKRYFNPSGLEEEKEIKVIFAATINLNHSMDSKNLPCIYKSEFLVGQKKPMQSKLRILFNNGVFTTPEYELYYRNSAIQLGTEYNYCSMFSVDSGIINGSVLFDLPKEFFTNNLITNNYNLTLFNQYHKTQIEEIIDQNLTIMEVEGYLNENDINNLDFSRPIFLEDEFSNSYWKLLEVNYKNFKTPTKLKLQKIIV